MWIRIRIPLLIQVLRPLVYRSSAVPFEPPHLRCVCVHGPPRLHFEPPQLLNFDFDADPESPPWSGSGSSFSKRCGSGYAKLEWISGSVQTMTDPEHWCWQLGGHLWFVCCREIAIRNHQLWTWRPCSRPQNSTCSRGGHSCAFTSFLFLRTPRQKGFFVEWWPVVRALHRDVVYLGWPLAPSYMSPNAGGGELRGLSQWEQLYTEAQINFGDINLYLTYASGVGEPNLCCKSEFALLRS